MVMEDYSRKKNKNDAVAVSLKNVLEQRHLEARLLDLERIWHIELKNLTREKLELTNDLQNFHNDKINVEYFNKSLQGISLRNYSKDFRDRLAVKQNVARMKMKYDFDQIQANDKIHIRLPSVEKNLPILQESGINDVYNVEEKPKFYRYHSNLSLRKSISDTDLFTQQTKILRGNTAPEGQRRNSNIFMSMPDIVSATQKSNQKPFFKLPKISSSPEYDDIQEKNNGFITKKVTSLYDKIRLSSREGKRKLHTTYKPSLSSIPRLITTSHKKTRHVKSTDIPETGRASDMYLHRSRGKSIALPPIRDRCHTVL